MHIPMTPFVLLSLASMAAAEQPAKQQRPAISKEVLEEWTIVGAELKWKKEPAFDRPFYTADGRTPEDFPVFTFHERRRGRFTRLPVPNVPFGVDLYDNHVDTAAIRELAALKNLHYLSMGTQKITDESLKALAGAQHLRSLHLYIFAAPITAAGLKELEALKELRELNLKGSTPSERNLWLRGKGELLGLKSLHRLRLGQINATTDAFKGIGALGELRILQLSQVHITDAGLTEIIKLPKLQSLEIMGGRDYVKHLTAAGLKELADAAALREFALYHFPMTEDGMKHIGTMKDLRALVLYSTFVGDAGIRHIAGLTHLQHLKLVNRGGGISAPSIKHLAGMKDMRSLCLRYAAIDVDGAVVIGEMSKLRSLDVAATNLTNTGLKLLSLCSDLEHLDIQGNREITIEGLKHLTRLKKLNSLYISGTKTFGTPALNAELTAIRKAMPNCKIETEGGYLAP